MTKDKLIRALRCFAKVDKCLYFGNCCNCNYIDLCRDIQKEIFSENIFTAAADIIEASSLTNLFEKQKFDLEIIADHYGERQFTKAIEELSELITAISKLQAEDYENANNCKNLIEEIADVEIMTYQLKYLLKAYADVEKVKTYKIKRTLKESGLGDSRESE